MYRAFIKDPAVQTYVRSIISNAVNNPEVNVSDILYVSRYMMALLVFKYVQRPRVAICMTVENVLGTKHFEDYRMICVTDRNIKSIVALHNDDMDVFTSYISYLRPRFCKEGTVRNLFVKSSGNPADSVAKEIGRFMKVSLESKQIPNLNDERAEIMAFLRRDTVNNEETKHYLNHVEHPDVFPMDVENLKEVHMATTHISYCLGIFFCSFGVNSSATCGLQKPTLCLKSPQWRSFVKKYPIKRDQKPPTRRNASRFVNIQPGASKKQLIDKWIYRQLVQRSEYIAQLFAKPRRPLNVCDETLKGEIEKQNWNTSAKMIRLVRQRLSHIEKCSQRSTFQSNKVTSSEIRNIENQKWPGLMMVPDLPGRGRGVIATHEFKKGDVVCDYKGALLSGKQGRLLYHSQPENTMGYMMFFKHEGKSYCIDATKEDDSYGRLINHSRPHPNIVGVQGTFGGFVRVLFFCNRDIKPGEELLYDYGKMRDSAGLEWLKSCPGCFICQRGW